METTTQSTIFGDYMKTLGAKLPGFDLAALRESRRKDVAALASIGLSVLDGAQAFGQKQADMARAAVSELQTLVTQKAEPGTAAGAVELLQQAFQKTLANLRELADIAQKTQAESLATISKRAAENVEELKALVKPAQ
ncbi:MAG: TIGR01841 family phasin [Cupriavidus sp.]|nr:TIGR01841 family phasin [Cupriavidus sp.]